MSASSCSQCGRPVEDHDRHVRFRLPEPLARSPEELTDGVWLSHEDADSSVMMQVPGVGAFVRCLLPVQLTGGFSVTFGVWVGVHPDDLRRAFATWWLPEYRDLVLDGRLANDLPVWGLLGAPARARVQDEDATPYVCSSEDPVLARVLAEEWPHEEVLGALPG